MMALDLDFQGKRVLVTAAPKASANRSSGY